MADTLYKHLISKAKHTEKVFYKQGNTDDIIRVIQHANKTASTDTLKFAKTLRGNTVLETCQNIWAYVKQNIRYKVDPPGVQWVKSPARLMADGVGDCKSFSIFTASILKNLGIPFVYRFVSYSKGNPTPTHVYVVAFDAGTPILIDAVWDGDFNTEKDYQHKKDYDMSKISYLAGLTQAGDLSLPPFEYDGGLSEGHLDLLIAKQAVELDKQNMVRLAGIGHFKVAKLDATLNVLDEALSNLDAPDNIGAIGDYIGKKSKKKGGSKFLKNVANKVKKGLKTMAKVVTAPQRLAVKGMLELTLPKASPFFLYLFFNNPAKLPAKARKKRKTAEKVANFIVNTIGMKRPHFMGIVRNGIKKQYGMDPESYIAKLLKGKISGIGIALEAVGILITLIGKLASLFGKNPDVTDEELKEGGADESDFAEITPAEKEALALETKTAGNSTDEQEQGTTTTGKSRGWC